MSYSIRPDQPVSDEIRRIVRKQLKLAIAELTTSTTPSDGVVHEARRHIKKARAALRLLRGPLRPAYRSSNRRLRRATRLLAPVADGEAVVRTFVALASQYSHELPPDAVETARRYLEDRQAAIDRRTTQRHVLQRVVGRIEKERDVARRYALGAQEDDGYRLLAPGFERTIRRSRAAMARAMRRETADHYHDWRRRVKDHWLQARLLNGRCDGRLAADAKRLDELDGVLGRCHDLALLAAILQAGARLTRAHAAVCLRVIRREQWTQRHAAVALGVLFYDRCDAVLLDRASSAWRPDRPAVALGGAKRSCLRVA